MSPPPSMQLCQREGPDCTYPLRALISCSTREQYCFMGPVCCASESPVRGRSQRSGSLPGDMALYGTFRRFACSAVYLGLRVFRWCAYRPRGPKMCMRSAVSAWFEELLTQTGPSCIMWCCYTVRVDREAYSELCIRCLVHSLCDTIALISHRSREKWQWR